MKGYCFDGPKFGTLVDCPGMEVHFPFVDEEHNDEYRRWYSQWGLADIVLYLDRDFDRLNAIPPKPSTPIWVYRWQIGPYGALVLRFAGEQR